VFPTDVDIPFGTLVRYWQATSGIDRREAERLCRSYTDAHLIEDVRLDPPTIRLPANIADYLQQEARPRATMLNRALLDSYRTDLPSADDLPTAWWKLPAGEPYLWHHLTRHLRDAAHTDELATLLRDLRWVIVKSTDSARRAWRRTRPCCRVTRMGGHSVSCSAEPATCISPATR
jgi:hypothetical protein